MQSEFTKRWDTTGFSYEEALKKKEAVDEAHGVGTSKTCWNSSTILPDERGGYKVIITTKN